MPRIKYDGDASSVARAQKALIDGQNQLADTSDKAAKKLGDASKMAERLAKQADPVKRHADQMRKLAFAVDKGNLSYKDAIALAQRYNRQLERAQQAGQGAFSPRMIGNVGRFAMQIAGGAGAVAMLTQALREMTQAGREAAAARSSALGAAGETAQLGGPVGRVARQFGEQLVETGVMPREQLGQAIDIGFQLGSSFGGQAGPVGQRFLRIARSRFVRPSRLPGLIAGTGKIASAFPGDIGEIADQLAVLSAGTTADVGTTATAFTRIGQRVRQVGFSRAQGMAMLAAMESEAPNINEAATMIKALLIEANARGFIAPTVPGTLANIEAAGGARALTNQEASAAFLGLTAQQQLYGERVGAIGDARGYISREAGSYLATPAYAAAEILARTRAGRSAAEARRTEVSRALFEASVEQMRREAGDVPYVGPFLEQAARANAWLFDLFGAEDYISRGMGFNPDNPVQSLRNLERIERNTSARTTTVEE